MSRSERNPEQPSVDQDIKQMKRLAKKIRRNPVARVFWNSIYHIAGIILITSTDEGRELLKDPEFRKFLLNKEARTGLLEDAIFNNPLTHPSENGGLLIKESAAAGRYVSWDFHRKNEFPTKQVNHLRKGKLITFPLPEVIQNNSDDYTSTDLLNIFEFTHLVYAETPKIIDLLNYGFVRERTYLEAYDEAGFLEKYDDQIQRKGLQDAKVYQITPKGNSLVFLEPDSGRKERKPVPELKLNLKHSY